MNEKIALIPIDFEFNGELQDLLEGLAQNNPVGFLKALSNVFQYAGAGKENENYDFVAERLSTMADEWRMENERADGQDLDEADGQDQDKADGQDKKDTARKQAKKGGAA